MKICLLQIDLLQINPKIAYVMNAKYEFYFVHVGRDKSG